MKGRPDLANLPGKPQDLPGPPPLALVDNEEPLQPLDYEVAPKSHLEPTMGLWSRIILALYIVIGGGRA